MLVKLKAFAPREPISDVESIGISTNIAADVALSTSGLPQTQFWGLLGRPGGCSSQDSQAKTRVCRGRSPIRMMMQTHRASIPRLRRLSTRPGREQECVGCVTQRSAVHEYPRKLAGTSQPCKDLQWKTTDDTDRPTTDRQTPSPHRRGDLINVAPGIQRQAQGTTKFDAATAGQTHATPTDIYDELATTYKYKPLYERGFVSPPTTATATQVATDTCARNTSNRRRFPDHRSRPPHQRRPGHGTHQRQATRC